MHIVNTPTTTLDEEATVKIVVDWDKCTGMGMCESLAPDVFEVDDDGSLVLHTETVSEGQEDEVREAVASCPTEALALED